MRRQYVGATHPPVSPSVRIKYNVRLMWDTPAVFALVFFFCLSGEESSLQMTLEDGFERFARACGQPSILLCDRGLMDGSVYMPPEEWACLVSSVLSYHTPTFFQPSRWLVLHMYKT